MVIANGYTIGFHFQSSYSNHLNYEEGNISEYVVLPCMRFGEVKDAFNMPQCSPILTSKSLDTEQSKRSNFISNSFSDILKSKAPP